MVVLLWLWFWACVIVVIVQAIRIAQFQNANKDASAKPPATWKSVGLWGALAVGTLFVIAPGGYWLAVLAALVFAAVKAIHREWRSTGLWTGVAVAAVVFGKLASATGSAPDQSAYMRNLDMHVTPMPSTASDPYADCMNNNMTKAHCTRVAANAHYKLTADDRAMVESTPEPTAPPATPEPTPDRHDERVQYQEFWNRAVGNLAMVYVCVNYAAKAAAGGDNVEASRALEYGQKFADNAKDETLNPPGDWNNDEIGARLFSAANSLSDAMGKMRSYLDDNKPSEASDAQDAAQEATSDVEAATASAQSSYESMGGKASDLETMQSKVQSTIAALDSIMGGSSSDNQ